jgi:ribosomal-protein-alanine N-acetyltransferase
VHPPETTRAVARWLRAAGPRRLRLLVCRREDGAIAGVVNLNEIVRGAFHSTYLGYYGFAPHAGQSYMAEGLGLVLRHAFRRMGLHRLEANIQPGNRDSRTRAGARVLVRGFLAPLPEDRGALAGPRALGDRA